ncbi:globin domain-containing protein [Pseudoruegeria sp. HB172150]|uniref:globin domain-containing protein n=1 Tax=Pseudoruegeria sp. HB172150 TaxID=2721164 RepID=UPI001553C422|nr:globin domain-containing protein [Pseudoruegeria sp. HB172150]
MPVTHEQIALIRWSFDKLRPRLEPASTFFYEELFRLRPDLREMFREDLAGQGMKFMSTLETVIDSLEAPATIAERIEELGQQHRRLGVTGEMFEPMGEALITTLREVLDDLGPDVEAAWRAAYADLSDAMVEKGDIPAS